MRREPTAISSLLASLLLLSTHAYAQTKTETKGGSPVADLAVPIGKTVDNFTFSESGRLSYRGKPFRPAIKVRPDWVRAFRISLRKDKVFAGAIAEDGDGQNSVFLLDLGTQTATPLQKAGTWSAAQQVFWSPSGRYMLALCAYEGQHFIGIDLQTKKVVVGAFLGPAGRLWAISDEPRWIKGADTLMFTVNETCSPYGESDCDSERILAKYTVSLNPATLKVTTRKIG